MIDNELKKFGMQIHGNKLLLVEEYYKELLFLHKTAIKNGDESMANELWARINTYKIWKKYLSMYGNLKKKQYYEAWCELDAIDIMISNVENNYDIKKLFKLGFIKDIVQKYMQLFPYKYFLSRESIIKKSECSICGKPYKLRNKCNHKPGKIYMGELCSRVVTDIEMLGVAIVENPKDKYAVLLSEKIEYDYSLLDELIIKINSPFENFKILNNSVYQNDCEKKE